MASTKKYDFKLLANGSYLLPASGVYFRLITSSAAINVQLSTGETVEAITAGQGLKNVAFNSLTLLNTTASGITGTILISDAEFVDVNLSGTVNVGNFGCIHTKVEVFDSTPAIVATPLNINNARRYLFIQNKSGTDLMWVTTDALGDPGSGEGFVLEPFEKYEPVSAPRGPVRLCNVSGGTLMAVVIEG
jgi:hypothetical protein